MAIDPLKIISSPEIFIQGLGLGSRAVGVRTLSLLRPAADAAPKDRVAGRSISERWAWEAIFLPVVGQFAIENSLFIYPIGSMYGIYANIWGILMGSMLPYMAYMDPMGIVDFRMIC